MKCFMKRCKNSVKKKLTVVFIFSYSLSYMKLQFCLGALTSLQKLWVTGALGRFPCVAKHDRVGINEGSGFRLKECIKSQSLMFRDIARNNLNCVIMKKRAQGWSSVVKTSK